MKKIIYLLSALLISTQFINAQTEADDDSKYETIALHSSFSEQQTHQLQSALIRHNVAKFLDDSLDIVITVNGKEKYVSPHHVNQILIKNVRVSKSTRITHVSESTNGYVQVFGVYSNKRMEYIQFITFNIDQLTGKITDIEIEESR
jgi:hypothetical protein